MKLPRKFFTFAFLIHAALVLLSLLLLSQNKYLFLAAELLILVSLGVTIHLYKSFLKPLNILSAGVDSIKDRDFSTTFVTTGQDELDKLIDVYNRMIEQLRSELASFASVEDWEGYLARCDVALETGQVDSHLVRFRRSEALLHLGRRQEAWEEAWNVIHEECLFAEFYRFSWQNSF